jgi:hypothetical protein
MKLRTFTTKHIFREAVKHLLPCEIIKRGKRGCNMPMAKWLAGPLRPLAEDMFSGQRLKRRGMFNPSYVRRLLDEHLARRRDNRKLLWTLQAYELWSERWIGWSLSGNTLSGLFVIPAKALYLLAGSCPHPTLWAKICVPASSIQQNKG